VRTYIISIIKISVVLQPNIHSVNLEPIISSQPSTSSVPLPMKPSEISKPHHHKIYSNLLFASKIPLLDLKGKLVVQYSDHLYFINKKSSSII